MITYIKTATDNNSLAHSHPEVLSSGLTRQYQEMYMAANKLVINVKTHLLVLGTKSMDEKMYLLNHTMCISPQSWFTRLNSQATLTTCTVS